MQQRNVLVIGTGGIGKRHIRGFLKTGRAQLTVVEPDAAKRADVQKTYGIAAGHADLKTVDLGAFGAAVICAPAHVHIPLAQACADAGLPFLLEKPLAVTMDGVDRLLDTVARKGLTARVGYVRRTAPEAIALRQQILEGRIGEVKYCCMNVSQEFPKYRPDFQVTYYARPETGGGAILDGVGHLIDLILWILGPVTDVVAMYDHLVLPGTHVEDTAVIALRCRSGALIQIGMNQFQKPNVSTLDFAGTKGNLMLDMTRLKFANDDSGNWETKDFMEGLKPIEAHEARFRLQADLFLDAVEGKPCHLATLEDARQNLRIALAAKESYRTGRIVRLPD